MLSIIILLRRSSKHLHGAVRQRYRSSMKEIGLVLIYPIVYCLFCFFLLVNRIYSSAHTNSNDKPNNYPLWVIQAVADPGFILIDSESCSGILASPSCVEECAGLIVEAGPKMPSRHATQGIQFHQREMIFMRDTLFDPPVVDMAARTPVYCFLKQTETKY